ncbi:MAG: peptide chain release factor N(5)-glutamine methyltransferase [bacterium]|nr:peptide chain release factor N(5)-glutamine methyltransferase [bacterium]MDA1292234.1 peptide chain release factor N(5)-glutamine methyltransferase [bacterium]
MNITEALNTVDIDRLDAEVLLAFHLGKNREWLLAHPEEEVDMRGFLEMVNRRELNEPVAYIVGMQEFYGRDFAVDPRVLIPRPSTERLVDLTLDFLEDGEDTIRELDIKIMGVAKKFGDLSDVKLIVDLCTGSGCIATTLALETGMRVVATDISNDALDVARENASKQGVDTKIDCILGDLTEPLSDITEPFIVVSNPPYIPEGDELMPDVADFEPHLALFSGPDGSDAVVKIYNSIQRNPLCRGCILECRVEHLRNLV